MLNLLLFSCIYKIISVTLQQKNETSIINISSMSYRNTTIIKKILRDKGITIKTLAERMGKPTATVYTVINNGNMSISTLEQIAKALDLEISDLFEVPEGYVHYQEKMRQEQRENNTLVIPEVEGISEKKFLSLDPEVQRFLLYLNEFGALKTKKSNKAKTSKKRNA